MAKIEIFVPLHRILLCYPVALSVTVLEIFTLFHFPIKVKMAAKSGLGTGYSCTMLQVQNLLKIALSLTVFDIFTMFYFLLKFKMAAKSGEN